ncbi:MAG: SPOR domain-containing protein [Alphaproteobacteria bacterium]|nr:SPOR domain-containing protein [Alphaproteobacteria bacterium]
MSNSNGNGGVRPGYPAQPAATDPRQRDPNRYPPQHDQRPGPQQTAWPPQQPAHDIPQDWTQPGGYPPAGDQYADPRYGQHEQAPANPQGYADPQARQEPALPAGGYEQPAGWPPQEGQPSQHGQPEPYRHPNEPSGVAEDPYSQPTLGVPGYDPQGQVGGQIAGRLPGQAPGAVDQAGQQASPYAAQFEAYVPQARSQGPSTAPPPAADPFAQTHGEPTLRGPSYDDDWPATAPPQSRPAGEPATGHPQAGDSGVDPRYAAALAQHQREFTQAEEYQPAGGYPPQEGYGRPEDQQAAPSRPPANGYQHSQAYDGEAWPEQPAAGEALPGYQESGYADPGVLPQEPGFAQADAAAWQQQPEYAGYDTPPTGAPGQYEGHQEPGLGEQGQPVPVGESYDEYDEEDDDEPRSGMSRLMIVAAALVGAIVIGAGLAFGYKTFLGPDAKIAAGPPVVRGDSQAKKVRPSDPGGKKFSHTDSKMLDRMSNQGRNGGTRNPDGSRRVSTIPIGRDGQVYNQAAAPLPSATPPSQPVVSVPGLTVVDGFAGQRAAAQNARQAAAGRRPIVVTPPKANANALSPVRPAVPKAKPKLPEAVLKPEAPKKKVVRAPATQQPPSRPAPRAVAPVAPRSSTGANGYVAVLASVPVSGTSRLDALKTFADIQQKHGSILGNRTPDVREANLGARGRYHRLMVGPPASREKANALCKQLKSSGHPSCWITAY